MIRRAACGLAAVAALAGCGTTSDTPPPPTVGAASTPAASGVTPSQTSAPTTSTTTVTRTTSPPRRARSSTSSPTPHSSGFPSGPCRDGQLRITASRGNGAGGHNGYVLTFRNVGAAQGCTLHGYPGVDVLGAGGRLLAHAPRALAGFYGGSRRGLPVVALRQGEVASAIVEWANTDDAHPGGDTPYGTTIAVTAANTFDAVRFARAPSTCALAVHPTVPGRTGSYPAR